MVIHWITELQNWAGEHGQLVLHPIRYAVYRILPLLCILMYIVVSIAMSETDWNERNHNERFYYNYDSAISFASELTLSKLRTGTQKEEALTHLAAYAQR